MPSTDTGGDQRAVSEQHTVVIAAGIVGLASAYYLAERGAAVTVVTQRSVGDATAPLARGGIPPQYTREPDIRMSKTGVAAWETIAETLDTDIRYRQAGYLVGIRNDELADAVSEAVMTQQSFGLETELREPDAVGELCPGFEPGPFTAVTYRPNDGYTDPERTLARFKRAVTAAGADLRTGTEVVDLQQTGGGAVTGVVTDSGVIEADAVVNAAGAWVPSLSENAGVDHQIELQARRAAVVEPRHQPRSDIPLVADLGTGVYFGPTDDQQMLVGGHFDVTATESERSETSDAPAPGPDASAPIDWQWEAVVRAADCASYFGPGARVVESSEDIYPVTPDERPIIERSKPGLFTAIGFSGDEFTMAPAIGQVIADLVIDGETELIDPAAYSSARFDAECDPESATPRF